MLVSKFPNHIFIPKIVPLVYDDTLSYYEFVCKLLNKVNEAIEALNALGIRVDALEAAVAELQSIVEQFDSRITQNETDIATLQSNVTTINNAIETINGAITTINNTIEGQQADINNIEDAISGINTTISGIQDTIADLSDVPTDITALENDVDALDTRVTSLEDATFGDISVSPVNANYSYDMHDLDGVDYSIDTIEGTGSNVTVGINSNNCITFHTYESGYIKKQLRLKNFISNLNSFDNSFGSLQVNFAFCYQLGGLDFNKYVEYANGLTLTQLLTGYTGGTIFTRVKLEANADNKTYDLILDCNSTSSVYWIQLEYIFCTLGEAVISQSTMRNYVGTPTTNLIALIKKNAGDYSEEIANLSEEIENVSTELTNYENTTDAAITTIQGNITTINNKNNSQDTAISNNTTAINNLNSVQSWNNFSDVFENGHFPPGAAIHYFKCYKQGKVVTMEIAGRGFTEDATFRFSTFHIGTLRSGLRSLLAPAGGKEVTAFGVSAATTNSGNNIAVTGGENINSPVLLNGNTLAIGVLTGSETTNPWTWDGYSNGPLPAYSLMVNTNGLMSDTQHNAFVLHFSYMSV